MPSVLSLAAILCASVALASDNPQLRGVPELPKASDVPAPVETAEAAAATPAAEESEDEDEEHVAPAAIPAAEESEDEDEEHVVPAAIPAAEESEDEDEEHVAPAAIPAAEESEDEDEEHVAPAEKVNATKLQEKREQEEGGTCCFSGESKRDTCGTCYPMSIASYLSKCSKKNECGHCGGVWCPSKCVIGAADPSNKCGTAYPTGTSSDPQCSKGKDSCKSCNGEWCRAGYGSNFKIVEGTHGREVPKYVPPEDETSGICCYRGKKDSKDMCGACMDVAKDSTCSVKSRCAGCGGTWCPGPRCVKAFADKNHPCNSAFPLTGIAKQDDFCSLNEKQCTNCKGAWCPVGNITYSDGTKYDPSRPYHPDSDQRLEAEDPSETAEAEQEVENDPGLDDLFPDGLA